MIFNGGAYAPANVCLFFFGKVHESQTALFCSTRHFFSNFKDFSTLAPA